MDEFLRKLRDLTERLNRDGKSEKQIQNAIKRFISQNPISNVFPDIRTMDVETFVKQFGVSETQIEIISSRIAPTIRIVEKNSKNFQSSVLDAVQKGLKSAAGKGIDGDYRTFARETLKGVIEKAHHIETEIKTAGAAIDRASSIEAERLAGVEWFRYVGPVGNARAFCAQHAGRIYHISEIMAMDNGQGLSVLYNMGGYHCRHRWESVSVEIARIERADWFAKAA